MKRNAALLYALAAIVLLPRTLGELRAPAALPPADLRDALGNAWPDLSELHSRLDLPVGGCAMCHLEMNPKAAARFAMQSKRWLSSAQAAAAETPAVTSTVCLSCHDGTVARAAPNFGPSVHGAATAGAGGADHPVGMDYRAAVLRQPGDYNDPAARPDIRLDDGKVGCMSCHVGHSRTAHASGPAGLTVDSCNACHTF